ESDYDEVVIPSHFAHGRDGLTMMNLGRHQKMRTGSCLGHIVHDLVSMTLPLCGPGLSALPQGGNLGHSHDLSAIFLIHRQPRNFPVSDQLTQGYSMQ